MLCFLLFFTGTSGQCISVDPTFNCGKFYVTPITYRNPFLTNKENKNTSTFCGPVLVHYKKTAHTYSRLFETINKLVPQLSNIARYGTDGEQELIDALSSVYPNASHLRCYLHFSKNLESAIKTAPGRSGQVLDAVRRLLEEPIEKFDEGFKDLVDKYPSASDFLLERRAVLVENLHCSNNNGKLYYTNASESINAKLKRFNKFESLTLLAFLKSIKEFFGYELGSSIDGYTGLSETYQPSQIFSEKFSFKWEALSCKDKAKLLQEFKTMEVPENITAVNSEEVCFDVQPSSCLINVPLDILSMIFNKAKDIVRQNHVMPAPSLDKQKLAFSTVSYSDTGNHHVTININTHQTVCVCKTYKLYYICSHTVAVSHFNNSLYPYIRYHINRYGKKTVSVETFTRTVDSQRAGLKDNTKLRKRNKPSTITPPSQRSVSVCSVNHEDLTCPRLVYLETHRNVKTCHLCLKPIQQCNSHNIALGRKIYRTYRIQGTGKTGITCKKQWAYSHIQCNSSTAIHTCEEPPDHIKHELQSYNIIIGD